MNKFPELTLAKVKIHSRSSTHLLRTPLFDYLISLFFRIENNLIFQTSIISFQMEKLSYILPGIAILYIVLKVIRSLNLNLFPKKKCESGFDEEEMQTSRQMLRDNFIVYKMLEEKGRKLFEKRVCKFISEKTFMAGKDIPEITDEMRIMVAASAIQITYGYPDVYFNHFETIILYADDYYSTITGQYHEGEVNAGGAIVLSWRSFLSGFSDMTDGKNLALHEMAHALQLTNIVDNEEYDFLDHQTMQEFEEQAYIEMQKIENGDNSFFRSYGATNKEEFFSVSVECFFEQSGGFKAYNPVLYSLLVRILKIDLLNFRKG
jgi:MtfA peptidase